MIKNAVDFESSDGVFDGETTVGFTLFGIGARRGEKRAIVAAGYTILTIAYHVLKDGLDYRALGPHYFERLSARRLTRCHVRKLELSGYDVTLQPTEEAA